MLLFNRYEYNPQTDAAGKGEFSRVYKATDKETGAPVAIKIYKINELFDHYRPIQDGQTILSFKHVNLCEYIGIQEIEKEDSFGEKEKLEVCISAFMNAGNLVSAYRENQQPAVLQKWLYDVLNGLSFLHMKGMIHGYIKPSNLMVTDTAAGITAKITDYAMGGFASHLPVIRRSQPLLSAMPYLSPEQLNAGKYGVNGAVSFNTDLWSLAVVIYEALTGEALFKTGDTDLTETITSRLSDFEPPAAIHDLPAPFNELMKRCLVKDAHLRAQSAAELLTALYPETDDLLELDQQLPGTGGEKLEATVQTEDEEDNTRIIALPKRIVTTSETAPVNDDTAFLVPPKPAEASPAADDDTTQFISQPSKTTNESSPVAPHTNDDDTTQFIAKPASAADTAGIDEDATRVIRPAEVPASPGSTVTTSISKDEPPIDQTIIIEKVKKDENGGLQKKDPLVVADTGSTKKPGIVVSRREKPVVLFNRYEYLPASDLIGKGGFSRVYKAYDKKLSRWVALKIYKTGEFSDRYSPIAEIKRVVNLDHSNICRYLDIEEIENENPFGENEKIQVCVMELLDSGNFAEYYKSDKNLDTLKKLVQDILNGLSYLHKNGIIHRDIKPANILIKKTIEGPVAKITDFGISKNSEAENNNSSSALVVSIPYMAPEQLNAKKYGINEKVSFNLDLWSLGVTIYEVITGKVLFKNSDQDNSEQIMANIMAPDMPEKLNDLPEPFRTVVAHCVVKNARERAARAEELMVLLNGINPGTNSAAIGAQAANTGDDAVTQVIIPRPPIKEVTDEKLTQQQNEAKESIADTKKTDTRFSVDEKTGTNGTTVQKDNRVLLTVIAVAVVIFIGFIIYLKKSNHVVPETVLNHAPVVVHTDSQRVTTPVVAAKDTTTTHASTVPKTDSTDTATAAVAKPVHVKEPKKEKATAQTHKKDQPSDAVNTGTPSKYIVLLSVENTCTLKVNGIPYGEIQNGKPLRIYLTPGKYILQFVSSSNSTSTYTANIEVKQENLGHADKFKIPI